MYPKWAFLGSRAWDGDLVNVIYLESNLKSIGVRKARKSKGKRLSKDGLAPGVLLHCDCGETLKSTSCTIVSSSLKQGGGLLYPVPVRLWWRAVFQGSGSCEALTANSQSSWEIGAPAGKGVLDGTPPPSSCICVLEHLRFIMLCWVSLISHLCIPQGHYEHVVIANDSV